MQPGVYLHYKGGRYEVIGLAHDSDTGEEMVVYRALYETELGPNALFVRSKKIFEETVQIGGKQVPRYTLLTKQKID